MKRKAILITTSSETNRVHSEDSKALYTFLQSQFGGKWEQDEIISLANPKKNEAVSAINGAKEAEYAFVMFIGRGKMTNSNLPWPEMEFLLGSNETISERELNPGSPRCTLLLACPETDSNLQGLHLPAEDPVNTTASKTAYNQALSMAESGLVKLNIFATDIGSATPSFIKYLVGETASWLTKGKGVLSLGTAINLAKAGLLRDGIQMDVDYLPGRRRHDFPFAVQI